MWKITNVVRDRKYSHLRRLAPKLEEEPLIAITKLKLDQSMLLSDEEVVKFKDRLDKLVSSGVITVQNMDPPVVESSSETPTIPEETPVVEEPVVSPTVEEPVIEIPAAEEPKVSVEAEKPAKRGRPKKSVEV